MRSRFGSALEPFVHCDLNLFEKRNDPLYRVTQADIKETFADLRQDLVLMSGAARLANLVAAVTAEGDAGPSVFETLLTGLRALQNSSDPTLTALLYQIHLLGQTGFRPQTHHCGACGEGLGSLGVERPAAFIPPCGGLACDRCARRYADRSFPLSPGSISLLQHALQWAPFLLMRLKATGQIRAELQAAIESYVTVIAGRRLPAADFLAAELERACL